MDGFWMAKYEVTQGQWKKIMDSNPSYFKSGDRFPVEKVSWNDAKKFISKLNQQSGNTFKLPTEAQCEYAGRALKKNVLSFWVYSLIVSVHPTLSSCFF